MDYLCSALLGEKAFVEVEVEVGEDFEPRGSSLSTLDLSTNQLQALKDHVWPLLFYHNCVDTKTSVECPSKKKRRESEGKGRGSASKN